MLQNTRFKKHFEFIGDMDKHHGIFAKTLTAFPFEEPKVGETIQGGSCC